MTDTEQHATTSEVAHQWCSEYEEHVRASAFETAEGPTLSLTVDGGVARLCPTCVAMLATRLLMWANQQ